MTREQVIEAVARALFMRDTYHGYNQDTLDHMFMLAKNKYIGDATAALTAVLDATAEPNFQQDISTLSEVLEFNDGSAEKLTEQGEPVIWINASTPDGDFQRMLAAIRRLAMHAQMRRTLTEEEQS